MRMRFDQMPMGINRVCQKNYLSCWVFTTMQSIHIRMNLSLSPSKNPGSAFEYAYRVGIGLFTGQNTHA